MDYARRLNDFRAKGWEAFRLVHNEEGLTIDIYGNSAVVFFDGGASPDTAFLSEKLGMEPKNIFLKPRFIQNPEKRYLKQEGSSCGIWIKENKFSFWVDPCLYHDVGFFPDQRGTRKMVQDWSAKAKVLNLFAYTGSFSVYADKGGALEVHSLDLNPNYLAWARKNWEHNGCSAKAKWLERDALEFLRSEPPGRYDLIICDPPTFSASKKMRKAWDVQRDHAWVLERCLRLATPGGRVVFTTNFQQFQPGVLLNSPMSREITDQTRQEDYPQGGHRAFLLTKEV